MMRAVESHNEIMIAHSFFLKNDRKQAQEKMNPYPPLATIYAASVLRAQGYPISFFDAQLSHGLFDFFAMFSSIRPDILVLYEDDFNFLTKMCLSHARVAALEMIKFAEHPELKIIVHSADATDQPADYLLAGADYVIAGEGEQSLLELVDWLSLPVKVDHPCPAGIIYLQGGEIIKTAPRPTLRHIDDLPQPAWDMVDFKSYQDVWDKSHGYFSLNMVTTRGCPYKCNWCSKPIWGQQYVCHSPEYIIQQLEIIISKSRPDHIWFADDIFGLKKGWVEEFASLIRSKNIEIAYTTQTRADLVTPVFAKALKASGCAQVWLGVESGSQSVLDSMDKGITLAQVRQARVFLKEQGIKVGFFIQLGYPSEDIAEIHKTRQLIIELLPEEIGVSVSYPLPGTKFYDRVKAELHTKTNWQESNDLEPTFASTFSAEFYQKIRNHLHRELLHINAGKEDSFLERKWHELMVQSAVYRNIDLQPLKIPAE